MGTFTHTDGGADLEYWQRMKKRRERLGFTRSELARKAELTESYIYRLERGQVEAPSTTVLVKIARALGTTSSELLGETEAEPQEEPTIHQVSEEIAPYLPGAGHERIVNLLSRTEKLSPESIRQLLRVVDAMIEEESGGT
jgi:transcriptional regulator with XRE-family HTH domain